MQPRNRRRHNPMRTEPRRGSEAALRQPRLIPRNLLEDIRVRGVVLGLVRERVRHVREDVTVRGRGEPGLHAVEVETGECVGVEEGGEWP